MVIEAGAFPPRVCHPTKREALLFEPVSIRHERTRARAQPVLAQDEMRENERGNLGFPCAGMERIGIEPMTSALQTRRDRSRPLAHVRSTRTATRFQMTDRTDERTRANANC